MVQLINVLMTDIREDDKDLLKTVVCCERLLIEGTSDFLVMGVLTLLLVGRIDWSGQATRAFKMLA